MWRSRNPPWTDLPQELLSAIANFLSSNPLDLLTFRSICHSWRSSIPNPISSSCSILSPQSPLKIPSPPSSRRSYNHHRNTSLLSATYVFVIHPPSINENGVSSSCSSSSPLMPNSWILFLEDSNPGKVRVRRPFSSYLYDLPLDFPRKLNLLGFHAVFLGRFHNICTGYRLIWPDNAYKVVLSDEIFVVAILEGWKLGLSRLGEQSVVDSEWDLVQGGKGFSFDDVIEFKGRVLAVDRRGSLYEINCAELKMNSVCNPIAAGGGRRKRLVESFDVLNLVVKCTPRETIGKKKAFQVYEFSEGKQKWVEVTSIGDCIFFISPRFSLCVSGVEFRGSFQKNCIIFQSQSFEKYHGKCEDHFLYMGAPSLPLGVWHLDAECIEALESFPGYSDVFWPPPDWLWPDDKSKRLGLFETMINRLLSRRANQNLKAKLKELSPLAEAVASYGDVNKQNIVDILMQPQMTGMFLKDLSSEIGKGVEFIKNNLWIEASTWQQCRKCKYSAQASNLKNEGHSDSSLPLSTSEHTNNVKDWSSRELERRIKTHVEVKTILDNLTDFLEANSSKLEDLRRLPEQEQLLSLVSLIRQSGTPLSKYFS